MLALSIKRLWVRNTVCGNNWLFHKHQNSINILFTMTTAEVVPISVKLEPIFCYGVKPNVFGGIHFTRENYLLYVNGCGISLYSGNDKKQELVPLADKGKHLTAIGRHIIRISMLWWLLYMEIPISICLAPEIYGWINF